MTATIPRLIFMLVTLFATTLANAATGLPAITDKPGQQRPGTFIWFDLVTSDRDKIHAYYSGLFGWEITAADGFPGYDLISNQGALIGGIAELPEEPQAAWVGAMATEDAIATAGRVVQLGGKVLEPAQPVAGRGVMALVEDNSGAFFVLLDTGGRDPESRPIRTGDWLWTDLFTTDPKVAGAFYGELMGLELKGFTDDDQDAVEVLMSDDRASAGVVEIPWERVTPAWLPYVRVADVDATVARSVQLGGRLFTRFDDGAILLDPAGAAIGIQQVGRQGEK